MDPVWAAFAEFWWIAPVAVGAGTVSFFSLRRQRSARARRLAYDASRDALRAARQDATGSRLAVRVARAELSRAQAERATGRASAEQVASARRALDAAQRETRTAAATLRVRRANLSADRAALGRSGAPLPLHAVMAHDDAVTARWMEYETDAAKVLAFPTMSDARVPATAAFLAELKTTRALRPAAPDARITPAQFGAYRDAVARLHVAFEAAEADAWRHARAEGSAPAGPGPDTAAPSAWIVSAQEIAANLTQTVIARGAEALARATAPRERTAPGDGADDADRAAPRDAAAPHAAPDPVWPVPSRTPRPPRP